MGERGAGGGEKTMLVMCTNPTTDGYYELPGHKIVAYVDVTPVVKTQAEHRARLQKLRQDAQHDIDVTTRMLANPEEMQDEETSPEEYREMLQDDLTMAHAVLEEVDALERIPLPVEELSKIYYQGITSVPAELKVDVVFAAGCPLDMGFNGSSDPGSPRGDLITAIQRHLRPGGQMYITVGDRSTIDGAHKSVKDKIFSLFSPDVEIRTLPFRAPYFEARGSAPAEQPHAIFTRPAAGGRRRRTRRARRHKRTSTHKGGVGFRR